MNEELNNKISEEMPLITFALIAYNQEKYIREAVDGAFSQTYSPLEIILSDDCSSDRTFEIMQEMAEDYGGPHKIVLNGNSNNLGIGGHISRVLEISSGKLVVMAAGDDISLPDRVDLLAAKWCESESVKAVYSDWVSMDEQGKTMEVVSNKGRVSELSLDGLVKSNMCIVGAACAIDREVYYGFGPLLPELRHEDRAWPVRARILGRIGYVDRPLVRYRVGGVSSGGLAKYDWVWGRGEDWYRHFINDYRQKIIDIGKSINDKNLLMVCRQKIEENEFRSALVRGELKVLQLMRSECTNFEFKIKMFIKWAVVKFVRMRKRF